MSLDPSTFDHLKPTEAQKVFMDRARSAAKGYAEALDEILFDNPDKTYVMRQLRTLAMWVNVAITRHSDGAPRG